MRRLHSLLFAGILSCTLPIAAATTLAELEARIGHSNRMRLAAAESEAANARVELASDSGIRLFGAATLAHGRDATRPERYRIDNLLPDGTGSSAEQVLTAIPSARGRAVAQLGIRLPLFGSRTALQESGRQAQGVANAQQYRHRTAELEVLKALRYAYAEAYYRNLDLARARAYAATAAGSRRSLDSRQARHLVLADERARLLATFSEAEDDAADAAAAATSAVTTIRLITGLEVDPAALAAPAFQVQCLSAAHLQAQIEAHPDIAYHAALAAERRRALGVAGTDAIEGGLSLSQSALRESGGRSGYSSAVSIDVSIPFELKRWRAARRGLAAAELRAAELALEARRNDFRLGADQVVLQAGIARQRLATLMQRESAEAEGIRVAELRLAHARETAMETLVQKRYAHYTAMRAAGRARLAVAQREADLLGMGRACPDPVPAPPAAAPVAAAGAAADKPGWYAWHLFERIATSPAQSVLQSLPPAKRILLSLTRDEIARVARPGPVRDRLGAFIEAARKAGIRVELLLGEPSWALEEGHADLLHLLAQLRDLPFAGLHLDIERSQLPPAQQPRWEAGITALTRRLGAAHRVPLGMSLHPRDASDTLLRNLAAGGVDEVTVMYYSTQAPSVTAFLARVLQAHPRLGISLAQSVERELPSAESYGRMAPDRALAALREVGEALQGEPNFRGILVQSLDQFLGAKP
ncbi:hypothetical protein [Massilia sp.]|uniref:hypothetical protein n=1 Tax=Massilia sp. TaxID=1882437 RepID=UPI003918EBB9